MKTQQASVPNMALNFVEEIALLKFVPFEFNIVFIVLIMNLKFRHSEIISQKRRTEIDAFVFAPTARPAVR